MHKLSGTLNDARTDYFAGRAAPALAPSGAKGAIQRSLFDFDARRGFEDGESLLDQATGAQSVSAVMTGLDRPPACGFGRTTRAWPSGSPTPSFARRVSARNCRRGRRGGPEPRSRAQAKRRGRPRRSPSKSARASRAEINPLDRRVGANR